MTVPDEIGEAIFTLIFLEAEAVEDREHVSPWMRRHAELRRVNLQGPGGDCVDLRWTLDYPADLAFLEALFEKLAPGPALPLSEVATRQPCLDCGNPLIFSEGCLVCRACGYTRCG